MLKVLYWVGPEYINLLGITPRVDHCLQLKKHLVRGTSLMDDEKNAYVIAAVLKNYLSQIPDSLLVHANFDKWEKLDLEDVTRSIDYLERFLRTFPKNNKHLLLKLLLIFRRQCKAFPVTLNSPILLGYFMAPYFWWSKHKGFTCYPALQVRWKIAKIIKFMILYLDHLFVEVNEEMWFPFEKDFRARDLDQYLFSSTFANFSFREYFRTFETGRENNSKSSMETETKNDESAEMSSYLSNNKTLENGERDNSESEVIETSDDNKFDTILEQEDEEVVIKTSKISTDRTNSFILPNQPSDSSSDSNHLKNTSALESNASNMIEGSSESTKNISDAPNEVATPSLPEWATSNPRWNFTSDALPSWAVDGFTLDANDLTWKTEEKEKLARKLIFEKLIIKRKGRKLNASLGDLEGLVDTLF